MKFIAIFIIVSPILFIIYHDIYGRVKKRKIGEENAQNFKKLVNKLSDNVETQKLAKKLKQYEGYGDFYNYLLSLFVECDGEYEEYHFNNLNDALKKEIEINKIHGQVAFIHKKLKEHYSSGWWIEGHDIFVIKNNLDIENVLNKK